jgi:hypothetical protein
MAVSFVETIACALIPLGSIAVKPWLCVRTLPASHPLGAIEGKEWQKNKQDNWDQPLSRPWVLGEKSDGWPYDAGPRIIHRFFSLLPIIRGTPFLLDECPTDVVKSYYT